MPIPRKSSGLNQEERDLLIELKTQMEGMRQDVKELKDNTQARLTIVENSKADRVEITRLQGEADKIHEDHEKRLRDVEKAVTKVVTWGSAALVAIGIAEFLISHFWK